jgi:tetratricopeptide (TPR) repeat protein
MDIDALWDYDRPAESEARFRAALDGQDGTTEVVLRTQLARALGLQGRFVECEVELDRARTAQDALGMSEPTGEVNLALERGRMYRSSGQPDQARPLFLEAYEDATAAGLDFLAADAAHMLAIISPLDEQVEWARRAVTVARTSADPRARKWIGVVENNMGWSLHELGRYDEAQDHFDRALAAFADLGDPKRVFVARWAVARGLRSLGRYDEALAIQRDLAARVPDDGYVQQELGELLTALGRPEEAKPHQERAAQLLPAT